MLPIFKRIVVKLGTKVVAGPHGNIDRSRLNSIVRDIVDRIDQRGEVIIVSSGAVGLGQKFLKNKTGKDSLAYRQACAAVGQNILMTKYQKLFAQYGISVAQVLVTADDLSNRDRYLNLREMLNELVSMGIVPVINENDSVSTVELKIGHKFRSFGDNDKLSALVASKLGADLLILLSDVNGVYKINPKIDKNAECIPVIDQFDVLKKIQMEGSSEEGRGGMVTKIEAARLASLSGVYSIIASGMQDGIVSQLLASRDISEKIRPGTLILPQGNLSKRRQWIGFSSGAEGVLIVNEGARSAIEKKNSSLLAVGIEAIKGEFQMNDVVSIQNSSGKEIGRGICNYSYEEVEKLKGRKGSEVKEFYGGTRPEEIVHKDNLVILNFYDLDTRA